MLMTSAGTSSGTIPALTLQGLERRVTMDNNSVLVEIRQVYGVERIYPANDTAKLFLRIGNYRKTFDRSEIGTIKELGFKVEVKGQEL
mgnify:CR=1 FL=1